MGTRALGMGGAFVAVADDATAPYWNPAGLGTGATFSMVLDWAHGDPRADGDLSLALAEGGGRNAVNVIIVDIRAMDTTGEITVLVVVGLCVYGLLRSRRRAATRDRAAHVGGEAA